MKKSLTILHLEDEPLDAELIHEAVRREGLAAEFHVAGDASSFRRLLESVQPDLVAELLMKPFTLESLTNAIRTVLGPTAA